MGIKISDEAIAVVRSVVGSEFSDMDVIRALHMAANDAAAAINIIFDTPHLRPGSKSTASTSTSTSRRKSLPATSPHTPDRGIIPVASASDPGPDIITESCRGIVVESDATQPEALADTSSRGNGVTGSSGSSSPMECDWWFVGSSEITGLSTCKGRRIKPGDRVILSYPSQDKLTSPSTSSRFPGRGRSVAQCSEIMRFSSDEHGEVGRIPNEWARCLLPLVKTKKIKIEGSCKSAPDVLGIMDAVLLSLSVYINSSKFRKLPLPSVKSIQFVTEDSTIHPVPTLFTLLGLTPFKKAELTPEDIYGRKRHADAKEGPGALITISPSEKWRKLSLAGSKVKNDEETISDADVDSVIGTSGSCELEEMTPPDTLRCDLRPYQKQALHWMVQLEQGACFKEAATTLHPCWDAYRLKDKRDLVLYVNAFSGEATTEFPSTLQMARGGILADAMGLGKTIMTIALVLANNSKGDSSAFNESGCPSEANEISDLSDQSPHVSKKVSIISGFTKLFKSKASLIGGGTLIICPMTLLGQWKVELETHVKPGSLTVYVHYGQSRPRDAKFLAQSDVVLTTYGVLVSEFSDDVKVSEENASLYSVRWFRVVLDEAHTIKSSKSQASKAAAALNAGRRWCLTGTPIQNNLEDVYSLIRFLRVEPWASWGLWHKLIQKPYEEGDERGLKLLQSILKSIMLRRTKYSTDREGRPILVLPPAQAEVLYCNLSAAEKDFYEALFKRSKVRFDQFVEQGRILHNYASILELLLRLRQCCDHPFLVMSRGDTQEFSDLNKLAKRFLQGGKDASGSDSDVPSSAYIKEVVEELRKGEGECPICLEAFEDAVLTPCAHRLCRECLLTSWRGATTGLCPVCRKYVDKKNLITAPTDSRFQIDVKKNWVESSKVSVLLQELEKIQPSGAKSIVFSQWTAFLDLLEIPLSRQNISFLRLDGTLSQQQRESVLNNFSEDKNILVLLMSLKAGGVGLNLTAASNAFLMDPWWNPAVEEQALMRIHRIGQNKSVSIKRFIVKGTVEERMEAVQARKNRMITGALTDQEVRTARIEELKMLFT